jgi:hypothetical protein
MNNKITENKKIIAISFLILAAGLLSWWQFYRAGQPAGNSFSETKVAKYVPQDELPSAEREGQCFVNSIAQPYRDDAWRCMAGNDIKDPCFYIAAKNTVVCDMNPFSLTAGFKLRLAQVLPMPVITVPAKDNWGWLILLEDDTICSPFTGTTPMLEGQTAAFGCVSADITQNIVLLGELKAGKIWTATEAIFAIEDGKPVIRSSREARVKEVWQ